MNILPEMYPWIRKSSLALELIRIRTPDLDLIRFGGGLRSPIVPLFLLSLFTVMLVTFLCYFVQFNATLLYCL